MMTEHKWTGVENYAFPSYLEYHYASYVVLEEFSYRREVAHYTYIQASSEMGYPEQILYLVILFHIYRLSNQPSRLACPVPHDKDLIWVTAYCKGRNITLTGHMVVSIFMSVAFYPYVYLFLMLNQSALNAVRKQANLPQSNA
ncbi:hypothetical protein [Marinimicrobium alkaliphilum]|uniref:hypothetical protein n=1 Tax=Marinimicrobium alkaliphilum TaxID=2202654 RepID=UPI000DBAA71A|nr:hypothetical protein [Marinimicrobium alkaliphilum]